MTSSLSVSATTRSPPTTLALQGNSRIDQLATQRTLEKFAQYCIRALYEAKGYPKAWIERRLRSIAVRGELTDEWKFSFFANPCQLSGFMSIDFIAKR
jgi:hypothetical protein